MLAISADINNMRFCPILDIVRKIRESTDPVIDLSVGVPNFPPAQHIIDAADSAVRNHGLGYGPSQGEDELLTAYLKYLDSLGVRGYSKNNLAVGLGAKHLLFCVLRAISQPGGKLLIPTPCWPTYFDIASLVGLDVLKVPCTMEQQFKLSAKVLEENLSDQVTAIILNSPCNPTGAVYTKSELMEIAQVIRKSKVWVILDDVYQKFFHDGSDGENFLAIAPDLIDRVVKIDSVSKSFGMPGWRVGILAAEPRLALAVTKLNSNSVSNVPPITSAAAASAFAGDQAFCNIARVRYQENKIALISELKHESRLRIFNPSGAFYLLVDVSALFGLSFGGRIIDDDPTFCSLLLEHHGVAVVPGSYFEADGYIRISYSSTLENVLAGARRLVEFTSALN